MATCPNCQAPNREGAKFCVRCGKPLGAAAPSSQPVTPPAPLPQVHPTPSQAVPPAPGGRIPTSAAPLPIRPPPARPGTAKRRPVEYLLIGCGTLLIVLTCVTVVLVGASAITGIGPLASVLPFSKSPTPTAAAPAAFTNTAVPSDTTVDTPSPSMTLLPLTPTPIPPTDTPTAPSAQATVVFPQMTTAAPSATSPPTGTVQSWWVDKIPPEVSLQALDGTTFQFPARIEKAPTVLLFWRTVDLASEQEIADLKTLYASYQARGLHVVVVAVEETREKVNTRFAPGLPPFTVLADPQGLTKSPYHLSLTPTLFFIGKDGKIQDVFAGMLTGAELEARTIALLQ